MMFFTEMTKFLKILFHNSYTGLLQQCESCVFYLTMYLVLLTTNF